MRAVIFTTIVSLGFAVGGCYPNEEPKTGTQTNWLRACASNAECGSEACHCGTCTHSCSSDTNCSDLPGSSCVAATDPAAVALCDGSPPSSPLCLPRCSTTSPCSSGQTCVAGACRSRSTASAHLSVDLRTQFQSLTGIGATLAYVESEVAQHPNADGLFAAMFTDLGLDALRFRNRYGYAGDDDLASTAAIVDAATASLGHRPVVVLTSWSPPPTLKSNGSTICRGEQDSCTLARLPSGGFDYDLYAAYWRNSMDAYAELGVSPDFIAIQNNPDFVPSATTPGEGCRFLPTQGTLTVATSSGKRSLEFPGYDQAMRSVLGRLQGLRSAPKIIAPETTDPDRVGSYVRYLDASSFDAIGHHLYGSDPISPDLNPLRQVSELAKSTGRPAFQTEMVADGLGTAVLLHHALVTEGASAYLHNALVAPVANSGALIIIHDGEWELQPAYHALRHFARFTNSDWVRAAADSDQSQVLASAWVSPLGAVTVVMVNPGDDPFDVALDLELDALAPTRVTRTAFDGTERSAELGSLPDGRTLRLPGHSVVTVAFESE